MAKHIFCHLRQSVFLSLLKTLKYDFKLSWTKADRWMVHGVSVCCRPVVYGIVNALEFGSKRIHIAFLVAASILGCWTIARHDCHLNAFTWWSSLLSRTTTILCLANFKRHFFITSDLNLPSLSILTFLITSSSWVLMPLTSFFYFLIPFRLESYSCKLVASEKKLFKSMNAADGLSPNDLEALSPPNSSSFPSNSFSSSFNSRYRFRVTRFHSQSLSTTTTSANRVFEAPLWWWMCAQSVHPSPSGLN